MFGRVWKSVAAALGFALIVAMLVPAHSALAAASPTVTRLSGGDRYATAVAISKAGFAPGVPVVYVATGSDYPDALSAAPAAAHQGGPLLLVAAKSVPAVVTSELKRLKPKKIVVVGGTGVIATSTASALAKVAPVKRLSGSDRYATSRAIAAYAFPSASAVYLATGRNFPDALSAGAAGGSKAAPVLLIDGNATSLDSASSSAVTRLKASTVFIAGGTGVVRSQIEAAAKRLKGVSKVSRLAGSDRYETSAAINDASFGSASSAYLATGTSFPDALAGAALAGAKHAPLYVSMTSCIPKATLTSITDLGVSKVTLLGGTGALTADLNTLVVCGPLKKPAIHVAFGDRSLTVAWARIPSALRYSVEYSTKSSFSGAKKVTTTGSSAFIKSLTNDKKYYVRVRAVGSSNAYNSVSSTASATPDSGYPRLLKVTVVPAGTNQVKVSWSGQGRATKVAVIAGSEGGITANKFTSAFYPATTTSITLTVPSKYRAQLGTGSGNPIFVKVATYNSLSAGTSLPSTKNEKAFYRLSLAGSYAYAGTTAPKGTKLRVAEWNVNSVEASKAYKGHSWKDRRAKVVAGVTHANPSVFATAELTTADAGLGNGKTQWQDLRDLLAPKGYSMAYQPGPAGTNATKGAHLFYKSSVVTVVHSGEVSPKSLLGKTWPSGLTDRYFDWAEFVVKSSGKHFIAAAVHLPADAGSTSYASLRSAEVKAINTYLSTKAGSWPIVVMGDFNSSFAETSSGPASVLVGEGYYDASATASRSNPRYSTANITHQLDNKSIPGYPYTPYKYQYPAPRIDYILTKNAPGSWAYSNQLILSGSKFNTNYQGSDHNLQAADIGIP